MPSALAVLDGELAVPCIPKSAYAGLKVPAEDLSPRVLRAVSGQEVDPT